MTLEGELMYLITDRLSPPNKRRAANRTMIMKKCRPNQSPQRNAGTGPAILDEASPSHRALSFEKTACAQPRVADLRR